MGDFANTIKTNEGVRVAAILAILKNSYPDARIALNFSSPWELLVAVILSAQCTDKKVNEVTGMLFRKYRKLEEYETADREEFERDIKPTGFFRNKARNILDSAGIIRGKYGGRIPDTMEELVTLPGVARKTANIILGQVYGKAEGIAVDTHVLRISQRLRLVSLDKIGGRHPVKMEQGNATDYLKDAQPEKVEAELMNIIPRSEWIAFSFQVIDHGRAVCKARNPDCRHCPLASHCPVCRVPQA